MRISDWSSDVCSSDLTDADDNQIGGNHRAIRQADAGHAVLALDRLDANAQAQVDAMVAVFLFIEARQFLARDTRQHAIERFEEIGRASCRERVCQYV